MMISSTEWNVRLLLIHRASQSQWAVSGWKWDFLISLCNQLSHIVFYVVNSGWFYCDIVKQAGSLALRYESNNQMLSDHD